MRTRNSLINGITSVVSQLIIIIVKFMSRRVFLLTLGATCYGIHGLFSQAVSALSVLDFGIGAAISYSLYRPLANRDEAEIAAIMKIYKWVFRFIGALMIVTGLAISPYISLLIKDDLGGMGGQNVSIEYIFILFVLSASFTYFNAYKQNLFIADQRKYITMLWHCLFLIIVNLLQIVYLLNGGNFAFYMIMQIITTVVENIVLTILTNRSYSFLKKYKNIKAKKEVKAEIIKNAKALFIQRIGAVLISSTDALVISKFIGIIPVGIYVNYNIIANAMNSVFQSIFSGIISSVGNYSLEKGKKEKYDLFKKIQFVNFVIVGFSCICYYCFANDFISAFFGADMVFEKAALILMTIRIYLQEIRTSVWTFKNAVGIYHQDRYRSLIEGVINIVLSIILVKPFGICGVLIGTIVSNVAINIWYEPLYLYRDYFDEPVYKYVLNFIKSFVIVALMGQLTLCISQGILDKIIMLIFEEALLGPVIYLLLKASIVFVVSAIILAIYALLFERESLSYCTRNMLSLIGRKTNR